MSRRVLLMLLSFATAGMAQQIHLKTRTLSTANEPQRSVDQGHDFRHWIVQFDHSPGIEDLNALATRGTVVAALPDNAVVVASGQRTFEQRGGVRGGVRWTGTLEVDDKISPEIVGGDSTGVNIVGGDLISAVLEFHPDVTREEQERLLSSSGLRWERPENLLPEHVLMRESLSAYRALAAQDGVAYIFPAAVELWTSNATNACAGMLTMAGAVPQYARVVHGWDVDADHAAHLSYVFGSLTPKVSAAAVQSEIIRAMNQWSQNANVTFQQALTAGMRTIAIRFASGSHGDAYPFDGLGGTLAHTFYPVPLNPETIAGDMHLDADENWHAGSDVDIYSVALHELGHAIGLGHSDKPGDVMYPYYRRNMPLSAGDIAAARSLYGPPPAGSTTVAEPATLAPLRLSVDAWPQQVSATQVAVSGSISGGDGAWTVQWQTDQGSSGRAIVSAGGAWSVAAVPLAIGNDNITFTGFDASRHSVSQTITVTRAAPAPSSSSSAPVAIGITSPAGTVISTGQSSLMVNGAAGSGSGVVRVAWQTGAGATGTAIGTERWSAGGIPLLIGTNTIVFRAYDSKGASAWASLVVVRR